MKSFFAIFLLAFSTAALFSGDYKILGDFEREDSFQNIWQAPRGIWAVSGGKTSGVLAEQHVANGHFSLCWNVPGRKAPSWPYLQYRFPEREQDLSGFKTLSMRVFNPGTQKQLLFIRFETKGLELKDKFIGVVRTKWLEPGENNIKIDIGQANGTVREKKEEAKTDWRKTDSVTFYFNSPKEQFTLFVDDIHLGEKPAVKREEGASAVKPPVPMKFSGFWDKIPVSEIAFTNRGEKASMPSRLQVAYDESNLFLRLVCPDSFSGDSKLLGHDDPAIWNGEHVELFIRNETDVPGNYYQFVFNPAGSRYDNKITGGLFCLVWNGAWQVKTSRIGKHGWEAVVSLPWHIFDYPSEKPPRWTLNLFRINPRKNGTEHTALSPTFAGHHEVGKFLPISVPAPDVDTFFAVPESFDVNHPSIGKNTASVSINARREGTVNLELRANRSVFFMKKKLEQGNNLFPFGFTLDDSPSQKLQLTLKDADGRTIAEKSSSFRMPPPLSIRLDEPGYRNNIYAGQDLKAIRGFFLLSLPESVQKKIKVRAVFETADGKNLQEKSFDAKPKVPFEFPAEALVDGAYRLRAWLEGADIGKAGETVLSIHKLPYRKNQSYVGRDRFLYVDGKPCFIFGVYHGATVDDLPLLRKAGFNLFRFYGSQNGNERMLSEAEKNGLFGIPMYAPLVHAANTVPEGVYPMMKKVFSVMDKYPNAIGVSIADEINVTSGNEREDMNKLYRYLGELNPYRSVQIVQNAENFTPAVHENFCDIYELDYYDSFDKTSGSSRPLSDIPLRVRELNKKLSHSKAIHVVFPGYDRYRTAHPLQLGRYANYRELRCLYYACFAEGATGFNFWPFYCPLHGCVAEYPGWQGIVKNNLEFKNMLPVLYGPTIAGKLKVNGLPENQSHVIVKSKGKYIYILAAYTGKEKRNATFSGEILKDISRLKVLAESRSIEVRDNSFSDSFGKYDVHLYTDDPNPPELLAVAENQAAADACEKAFRDRNKTNLLHQTFLKNEGGLKIELTNAKGRERSEILKGAYPCAPYYLVDGMRRSPLYFPKNQDFPVTISFRMAEPVTIGRIGIRTERKSYITDGVIRAFCNGKWIDCAKIENTGADYSEFRFHPVTTKQLELVIRKIHSESPWFFLDDVEAYSPQ